VFAKVVLDTTVRSSVARRILSGLTAGTAASTAQLRGSLAGGTADPYSDIDVLWEVPDETFDLSVTRLPEIVTAVGPVAYIRSDPAFQRSAKRRLIFVQLEDLPLFWRVDLDVFAQSIERDYTYDVDNPRARGDDWSLTHSALMNAIASVKALLRNRDQVAEQLLFRGFHRVGLAAPQAAPQAMILELVQEISAMDPSIATLADQIVDLHRWAFGEDPFA
jgi:predicted nucleotidyltransferase